MTHPIRLNQERSITITTTDTSTADIVRTRVTSQSPLNNISLASNCELKIGPYTNVRTYTIREVGEVDFVETQEKLLYNYISGGLRSGGVLSANANPTLFDLSGGDGIIVDNWSDPLNPTTIEIRWPSRTAIVPEFLNTDIASYICIDAGGNVVQFPGVTPASARRDYIVVGLLIHLSKVVIQSTPNFSTTGYDTGNVLNDLVTAIGFINVDGNIFEADGTDLKIAKTSGETFAIGGNLSVSTKTPNNVDNGAISAPFLVKFYKDGAGSWKVDEPLNQNIDPDNYDDGSGTLAAVPNSARWQIQRIYYGGVTDDVIVQYGQATYASSRAALEAIQTEDFDTNPIVRDAILRCFLVIRKGTTDLSDTSRAIFVAADKFGQVPAQGERFQPVNGIATVTETAKTGPFTVNMNKAYRIDNSSNAVTGTLREAEDDYIGQVCECWIMDDASVNNVIFNAPTEASVINGVAGGGGLKAQAVVSSANSNYKKISVTIISKDEYLIDGVDSVSTV